MLFNTFSVLYEGRQFKQQKPPLCFDAVPLSNGEISFPAI